MVSQQNKENSWGRDTSERHPTAPPRDPGLSREGKVSLILPHLTEQQIHILPPNFLQFSTWGTKIVGSVCSSAGQLLPTVAWGGRRAATGKGSPDDTLLRPCFAQGIITEHSEAQNPQIPE